MANRTEINSNLAQDGLRITRRQINQTRAAMLRQHSMLMHLLEQHQKGEGCCTECQVKIKPYELKKVTLDAMKLVFSYTMPAITAEDLDVAVNIERSLPEIASGASEMLTPMILSELVLSQPKEAARIRDTLTKYLQDMSVVPINPVLSAAERELAQIQSERQAIA